MSMRPLRILMVSAEFAPWAKTGGLADMVSGLAGWLHREGHDVRVLLPAYRFLPGMPAGMPLGEVQESPVRVGGTHPEWRLLLADGQDREAPLYLADAPALFRDAPIYGHGDTDALRCALLCQAVPALSTQLDWIPDLVHCHDWHAGLAPLLLRTQARIGQVAAPASLLTIHNIGYQGDFPRALAGDCGLGALTHRLDDPDEPTPERLNFLRIGLLHADALTTVSPTHASEIRTAAGGMGLDQLLLRRGDALSGILNGVDYGHWDPATDPLLPVPYSLADPTGKQACREVLLASLGMALPEALPLLGMVTRLAGHKGIDLVLETLPALLEQQRLAAVVLGSGESRYMEALHGLAERFPTRMRFIIGHDEALAHRIFAAADLFAVPSLYEPCGLTQLYAMRYGAIPVVRATGGLRDSVAHFDPVTGSGTGSLFEHADAGGLRWGLEQALAWHAEPSLRAAVRANAMRADFSWDRQGPSYLSLYRRLVAR